MLGLPDTPCYIPGYGKLKQETRYIRYVSIFISPTPLVLKCCEPQNVFV